MDLLAARSRCIFFVMLTNPIQVLSETELLGHKFTVYGTAENPLFLAKEVAECIDYAKRSNGSYNTTMMLQSVDEEEKVANIVDTLGGNQQVWFLTEDGLYEVLMQSRKPIAKEFKKGVKEILKTIRKTGGYIATKQDDTPEEIMARALTIAQATLAKREERLKQLEAQAEQQQVTIVYFWNDNYAYETFRPWDVTHWREIPSFDEILEANRDVLERIKEKGD